MRKFHNLIKRDIIRKAVERVKDKVMKRHSQSSVLSVVSKGTSWGDWDGDDEDDDEEGPVASGWKPTLRILDLACGRGGDLHKWTSTASQNGVNGYLEGVDI